MAEKDRKFLEEENSGKIQALLVLLESVSQWKWNYLELTSKSNVCMVNGLSITRFCMQREKFSVMMKRDECLLSGRTMTKPMM